MTKRIVSLLACLFLIAGLCSVASAESDPSLTREEISQLKKWKDSYSGKKLTDYIDGERVFLAIWQAGADDPVPLTASSRYDLSAIPTERLASSMDTADQVILIYPTYQDKGYYAGVYKTVKARQTTTVFRLVDPGREFVYQPVEVTTSAPPESITVTTIGTTPTSYGSGDGEFRPQDAIDKIAEMMIAAPEPGTVKPAKQISADISVGDTVTFGVYSQTAAGGDRTPIEWQVLEVRDGKALLLSKYGLEKLPFQNDEYKYYWENSTLRTWLNGYFLQNAFTWKEKNAIILTDLENTGRDSKGELCGLDHTMDHIFLLSHDEAVRYLHIPESGDEAECVASRMGLTAYASNHGEYGDTEYRTAEGEYSESWWLRTTSAGRRNGERVRSSGRINPSSTLFRYYSFVRPALWLDLSMVADPVVSADPLPDLLTGTWKGKGISKDDGTSFEFSLILSRDGSGEYAPTGENDTERYAITVSNKDHSCSVTLPPDSGIIGAEGTWGFEENLLKTALTVKFRDGKSCVYEAELSREIIVGESYFFGAYPQTEEDEQTPVEWIVLEIRGGQALLLSKYGLDAKPYNTEDSETSWEDCSLRFWLNHDFLTEAFSAAEQKFIVTTKVDNGPDQCYSKLSSSAGNNTQDKIFLLSYAEAEKYMLSGSGTQSRVAPTRYALQQGVNTTDQWRVEESGACEWWLRSPGSERDKSALVSWNCSVEDLWVHREGIAVRPAMWITIPGYEASGQTLPSFMIGSWSGHGMSANEDAPVDLGIVFSADGSGECVLTADDGTKSFTILLSMKDNTFSVDVSETGDMTDIKGTWTLDNGLLKMEISGAPDQGVPCSCAVELSKDIVVGESYLFGAYPQTETGDDATPIEWIVLDVQEDRALLLSKYGLETMPFDPSSEERVWETSMLRAWLNDAFIGKAFSLEEKERVIRSTIDNSWLQGVGDYYAGESGPDTMDQVFLLSYREISEYSGLLTRGILKTAPTGYALTQGAYTTTISRTEDGEECGEWWLRSSGNTRYHNSKSTIDARGELDETICQDKSDLVVRPALWLNISGSLFIPAEMAGVWGGKTDDGTQLCVILSDNGHGWYIFRNGENEGSFPVLFSAEDNTFCVDTGPDSSLAGAEGTWTFEKDRLKIDIKETWKDVENRTCTVSMNRQELIGKSVRLGVFPQTKEGNDLTPVDWQVLDMKGDQVLLISQYGLDARKFIDSDGTVWENSPIREWLNGAFLNSAFSESEQQAILLTDVDNSKRQSLGLGGDENTTQDRIFLLSAMEASKYFNVKRESSNESAAAIPTPYAKEQKGRDVTEWWLRSSGDDPLLIGKNGEIESLFISFERYLVRPVLWLKLSPELAFSNFSKSIRYAW